MNLTLPSPYKKGPERECRYWLGWSCSRRLPQSLPVDIDPEPGPVVRLTMEAVGLCCQVLCLISGNAGLLDVDGHPFLEGFDVRDEG